VVHPPNRHPNLTTWKIGCFIFVNWGLGTGDWGFGQKPPELTESLVVVVVAVVVVVVVVVVVLKVVFEYVFEVFF